MAGLSALDRYCADSFLIQLLYDKVNVHRLMAALPSYNLVTIY